MKKQFLLSLAASCGRVILGFVFFWQVSQALGLTMLGEYLYVTVAVGYFGTLVDYGFNLFVLNTAPRNPLVVRALFVRVLLAKLILTAFAAAMLAVLYGEAFVLQGALVVAIFFTVAILQSFSSLLVQFYKAMGRFDHEFTSNMLNSLMPVAILFAIEGAVTLVTLGWIVLAVRLVVLLFQTAVFFKISHGQRWTETGDIRHHWLPRALTDIQANSKYAVFAVLGAVFLSIDLVVMRLVLTPEDVSIYGTAMRAIMAVIIFFEVLTGVFIPGLARRYETSPEQFIVELWRFVIVMLAGAGTVSAGLMIFGPWAITMAFGETFAPAGLVLQALSVVLIFRIMTVVSGSLLTIYGLQSFRARVMAIVLPIHLGLNLVLQNQFGIWGAVGALSFSFLLLFALNSLYLIRKRPGTRA